MDEENDKIKNVLHEMLAKREHASFVIRRIKELHGEEFVNECLRNETTTKARIRNNKGNQVRERYQIIKTENPHLSESEIRKILSQEFRIKDKAVQHHLYKKI